MVGGPLPGALATVDVSRDEPNTGAELSQESRTTYVTIVHRCSVSGEPPVLCTLQLMSDVYRFRVSTALLLFVGFVTADAAYYEARRGVGGRYIELIYRTASSTSIIRPNVGLRTNGPTVYVVRAGPLPSSWPLTWAYPWAATKVDVEGSWPAVRPAGLHPVATRWHLSIEHPSFPRAHHSRRPSFDGGR